MPKNIVNRVNRNLARRLKEARKEAGLSSRAIADRMPSKLSVSHTTITTYENGTAVPPIDVLAVLADLYKRPLNWFLENRESLSSFRFLNPSSRMKLADMRQYEAQAGKWAEAYFRLSRSLGSLHRQGNKIELAHDATPQSLAETVRHKLNLDDNQPIPNIVSVLESWDAWAFELKANFGIDGAAARHGNEYIVVINPSISSDRVRMNVAHELAHRLYDECKDSQGWTDTEVNKRAYIFASSLLMPASQLKEAFDGKSFIRLVEYKKKFGISLAAMIFMAEKSRIINTTASRYLWQEYIRRGWKQQEPGMVQRDRAVGFEMILDSAIQTKKLTWNDAERITGIKEDELRERLVNVVDGDVPRLEVQQAQVTTLRFPSNAMVPQNADGSAI